MCSATQDLSVDYNMFPHLWRSRLHVLRFNALVSVPLSIEYRVVECMIDTEVSKVDDNII